MTNLTLDQFEIEAPIRCLSEKYQELLRYVGLKFRREV